VEDRPDLKKANRARGHPSPALASAAVVPTPTNASSDPAIRIQPNMATSRLLVRNAHRKSHVYGAGDKDVFSACGMGAPKWAIHAFVEFGRVRGVRADWP